ncbi:hypothetical protein [Nocardiopsis changdeensis]|uniref:hypothetical protein n=1 Tax=Nocardiopsis changdeensis TaxID=2831969 RepID=UPI003F46751E
MSHYRLIVALPEPPDISAGTALGDALLRELPPLLGEPDYAGGDADPAGRWWDWWMVGAGSRTGSCAPTPTTPWSCPPRTAIPAW